jgi:hypothetical protein
MNPKELIIEEVIKQPVSEDTEIIVPETIEEVPEDQNEIQLVGQIISVKDGVLLLLVFLVFESGKWSNSLVRISSVWH